MSGELLRDSEDYHETTHLLKVSDPEGECCKRGKDERGGWGGQPGVIANLKEVFKPILIKRTPHSVASFVQYTSVHPDIARVSVFLPASHKIPRVFQIV